MRLFLLIFSVVWVALGAAIVLYTNQARSFLREFVLGMNIRLWAFVPLVVGLLFILGAFLVCEVFWILLALGIIALAKGAYLAFAPPRQVNSLLEWWFDHADETTTRLWGLFAFTIGVVLFSRLF